MHLEQAAIRTSRSFRFEDLWEQREGLPRDPTPVGKSTRCRECSRVRCFLEHGPRGRHEQARRSPSQKASTRQVGRPRTAVDQADRDVDPNPDCSLVAKRFEPTYDECPREAAVDEFDGNPLALEAIDSKDDEVICHVSSVIDLALAIATT
jgi:hypothetical protein